MQIAVAYNDVFHDDAEHLKEVLVDELQTKNISLVKKTTNQFYADDVLVDYIHLDKTRPWPNNTRMYDVIYIPLSLEESYRELVKERAMELVNNTMPTQSIVDIVHVVSGKTKMQSLV